MADTPNIQEFMQWLGKQYAGQQITLTPDEMHILLDRFSRETQLTNKTCWHCEGLKVYAKPGSLTLIPCEICGGTGEL